MCPEEITERLWWLMDHDLIAHDELSLRASANRTLPTFALCLRLQSDPVFRSWTSQLHEIEPAFRTGRAEELTKGAPRGLGRRLFSHLLLVAAESGKATRIMSLSSIAAFPDATLSPLDPKRAPKMGPHHDRCESLARAADRLVRRVTEYPLGIEPAENSEAKRRSERRLIESVAAKLKLP